jgi:alkylated DNA repair dioxygenase AlkB
MSNFENQLTDNELSRQNDLFAQSSIKYDLPGATIRYYPNVIPNAVQLFLGLEQSLAWQQDSLYIAGKSILIQRLNTWYGDEGADYSYSGLSLSPLPWTPALLGLKTLVEEYAEISFNSVLANLYRTGNDSVAWHSDDEKELGNNPTIASLSLGATRKFSFRHKTNRQQKIVHLLLEPGSLLLMEGATQHYWQHQIAKTTKLVGARINLTFRRIVK